MLLCLSGSLMCAEFGFGPQIEHFGKKGSGFTIITFDFRGYGNSQRPAERFHSDCFSTDATDAHALMESLGFVSYFVLGWCHGGAVGIVMAAMFPEAVEKLILLGSRSFISKEDFEKIDNMRNISSFAPPYKVMTQFYGYQLCQELWSKIVDVDGEICAKKDANICREKLSKIVCPTLILHGGKDQMVPPSHAQYLAEHIRGSQLVIMEEGTHWLHRQTSKQLQEVHAVVKTFLSSYSV